MKQYATHNIEQKYEATNTVYMYSRTDSESGKWLNIDWIESDYYIKISVKFDSYSVEKELY